MKNIVKIVVIPNTIPTHSILGRNTKNLILWPLSTITIFMTDICRYGQGDSMTDPAQRVESVKTLCLCNYFDILHLWLLAPGWPELPVEWRWPPLFLKKRRLSRQSQTFWNITNDKHWNTSLWWKVTWPKSWGGGRGNPPLLTTPLSTVGWLKVGWVQKPKKGWKTPNILEKKKKKKCVIVSKYYRYALLPAEGVTDRQTDRHCDSMTESAQWADSVKINTCIYFLK